MPIPHRRILIYGVTGSGKTTLAKRLGEVTGLPWHEADALTWEPGWVQVPADEQVRRISEVCAGEEWILDSAYAKWMEVPLARAELIVGLDYSRWLSFGRLLKRTLSRQFDKKTVCNGNRESLKNMLSSESILLWHFRSFKRKRQRMREWAAESRASATGGPGPVVLLFNHPRQAEAWLKSLGK